MIYNLFVDSQQQKNLNSIITEDKIFQEQKQMALEYYKIQLRNAFKFILLFFIIFILAFLFIDKLFRILSFFVFCIIAIGLIISLTMFILEIKYSFFGTKKTKNNL